jgi:lysophospholipase L1-like esterase
MGPDPRTPAERDAEGKAALGQLLTREGLFGWGPVLRLAVPALAEAVAERTATGRISAETAARAAAALERELQMPLAPTPAPDWVANPGFATPDPTPTKG